MAWGRGRWWGWRAALCGVHLVITSVGCGGSTVETSSPHILVISVDALRADHLSCYGYDRPTTPELDRVAARGTRFSAAFANTHGTPPSHTTMLSSLYQESHEVGVGTGRDQPAVHVVPRTVTMVQEILADAGWRTVAVTGGGYMGAEFGFARGFHVFDDRARGIEDGAQRLLAALREALQEGRPVFALFHTYQVHSPYEPPVGFDDLFGTEPGRVDASSEALLEIQDRATKVLDPAEVDALEALYDGEIRFTDHVLGRLFRDLDDLGVLRNTVLILTSDHGEEFGEHGGVLHGGTLFEELIHVPLIVAGPGVPEGAVEPRLVSLVDVAPTVLTLAGLQVPSWMEGADLIAATTVPWPEQRVFAQYGRSLYCVRTPRWKLIHRPANGSLRLFDLRRDPAERRNVAATHTALVEQLASELASWRSRRPRLADPPAGALELTAERLEELRALGYVR